jgi:NAD(P)-dependent dehydrogenase (short-subunit alcohol dehydrogenase family)
MFTYELARRLEGSGVTANALHPGVARTAFGQEDATLWMRLLMPIGRPFLKTPHQAAETPVFLASAPEVQGVTGRYFANKVAKASSRASYDVAAAKRLWDVSAQLVGLAPTAVTGAA